MADRAAQSTLIAGAFPNGDGDGGGVDTFVSFCDFVKNVQLGGDLMVKRLVDREF